MKGDLQGFWNSKINKNRRKTNKVLFDEQNKATELKLQTDISELKLRSMKEKREQTLFHIFHISNYMDENVSQKRGSPIFKWRFLFNRDLI